LQFSGRRKFLTGAYALGGLLAGWPGPARAALMPTPRQTPGPFYPQRLPLDSDNDLYRVAGQIEPAAGVPLDLSGRVLTEDGRPMAGVLVEIWQCDASGRYHHPRDPRAPADPGFQGYGRNQTLESGDYRFRTIRPVPYPGRTPHIHVSVSGPGMARLTTQLYLAEEAERNARDLLYRRLGADSRQAVTIALTPAADPDLAQLAGRFDLVIGRALLGG
jgi:protocatechuate 3,4-dioxygenase beta subunit